VPRVSCINHADGMRRFSVRAQPVENSRLVYSGMLALWHDEAGLQATTSFKK